MRFAQRFVDIGRQQRLIILGEQIDGGFDKGRVGYTVKAVGDNRCLLCAEIFGRVKWQHTIGELIFDLRDKALRLRPHAINLVDKENGGDAKLHEDRHEELGLRLDAFDGRDDEHRAIEHAKGALDFGDKVGMTGGIDQVDFDILHRKRDDRGFDRNAPSPFQLQRVGLGGACIDAANLVDDLGFKEDALGQAGLAGIDMGDDADIDDFH